MKRIHTTFFAALMMAMMLSACETVIDVDLNEADPKLVVEAKITDQPGSAEVLLTSSVSYFEPEAAPLVSGAIVTISDDLGNLTQLSEESPGKYSHATLIGVPGRTYTLMVETDKEKVTGVAYMPEPVAIDSLSAQMLVGPMTGGEDIYLVRCHYTDPAGINNFYRPVLYLNGVGQPEIFAFEDSNNDGISTAVPVFSEAIKAGDSVSVALWTIDRTNYYYYNTFAQNPGAEGASAAPGNPTSNLSGDVLGVFTAASESRAHIQIPN